MTTHELFTSLLWLVLGGYALYLVWYVARELRERRGFKNRDPIQNTIDVDNGAGGGI
jgi:hypothetical protein